MKKKILSLDGGGSWAILQAMALENIYSGTEVGTKCIDILNQFDIIVANSGGSLMLAGMIENSKKDIGSVIEMFLDSKIRESVFSQLRFFETRTVEKILRLYKVGPKYKASRKIEGLKKALQNSWNIKLWEIKAKRGLNADIVICGYDFDINRAVFFKSNQKKHKYEYTLADAINAASNAPVNYFDEPVESKYDDENIHRFWDGAIGGNNNPVLIGITEALIESNGTQQLTSENLLVLSIGTGNNLLPIEGFTNSDNPDHEDLIKRKEKSSLLGSDIGKMAKSILSEPPEAANFMAHLFLGGKLNKGSRPAIIRVNPLVQPKLSNKKWSFPPGVDTEEDKKKFCNLIKLEMDAVKQSEVDDIYQLGKWWLNDIIPNQGISYDGRTFEVTVGYDKFTNAKTEWLNRTNL
jgi:uncharacterized protein